MAYILSTCCYCEIQIVWMYRLYLSNVMPENCSVNCWQNLIKTILARVKTASQKTCCPKLSHNAAPHEQSLHSTIILDPSAKLLLYFFNVGHLSSGVAHFFQYHLHLMNRKLTLVHLVSRKGEFSCSLLKTYEKIWLNVA